MDLILSLMLLSFLQGGQRSLKLNILQIVQLASYHNFKIFNYKVF